MHALRATLWIGHKHMRNVFLRPGPVPLTPRLFRKRVRRADRGLRPGELVAVRDVGGGFVGRAFWSPEGNIALWVLDRDENGPPIDGAWFFQKIAAAQAIRTDTLALSDVTDAYRIAHAEGDGLPALIIDRFHDVAVVDVGSRGMFEHLDEIEEAVLALDGIEHVVVRAGDRVCEREGFSLGAIPPPSIETEISEYGLRFSVDCGGGHKTGFFVDQRDNRVSVSDLAAGRRVLDLCCYTGGFALAAVRGGATAVTAVDLDEKAIEKAKVNARLNAQLDGASRIEWRHADAFDVLREGVTADLVVLDPPKLASHRDQLQNAWRKAVDLNALGLGAVTPGGLLFTFSCTGLFSLIDFSNQLREASVRAGRDVRVLQTIPQPPDHPVHVHSPEGRYLHGALLYVV